MVDIAANVREVNRRIEAACARAGRKAEEVVLVAVSKTKSFEEVLAALSGGANVFGENYLQEAAGKIALARARKLPCRWHFIGTLQRRKVRDIVVLFDMIHSLDSLPAAEEINRRAAAIEKVMPALIEVNIGGEESKSGVVPGEPLRKLLAAAARLEWLQLKGLMTMPPPVAAAEESRPYFRKLAELLPLCRQELENVRKGAGKDFRELSMGLSGDFEVAVEEGATMVRVGTAIFGPRT